jgi:hypothetical protein
MEIPNEIMKKILLYRVFSPHPVSILFKEAFNDKIDELDEIIPGDYEYGMEDSRCGDDVSFAHYHFHQEDEISNDGKPIYHYAHMGSDYVSTLNEYLRNH